MTEEQDSAQVTGPLAGVRVVDLTQNVMGPYASLLLADMGADVAKIESPAGDTMRAVGATRSPGMSAAHLHLNRNKRSAVIDLKADGGADAVRTMLRSADVLLHSLRPRAMARLGLDYERVAGINPRLVYCGAFGFGQDGPYADRPAYDDLMQAAVGMSVLQARGQGRPQYVALAIADRLVGMAAASAVGMALYRRSITGRGQEVQVPMFETFTHFAMGEHLAGYTFDPPEGEWGYARVLDPGRRPFQTQDGYIAVNFYIDKHWAAFFAAAGRPDLADDPRFTDVHTRAQHMGVLYELMDEVFGTRPTDEWVAALTAADLPVVRVNDPATLLDDAQMVQTGFLDVVAHPTEGPIRSIGVPQTWSESQPRVRRQAPRLGENTTEVLRDFGVPHREIERLLAIGTAVEAGA